MDGEEGSAFHVTGVKVLVDEHYAAIDSTAIKFEALDRLIGMKLVFDKLISKQYLYGENEIVTPLLN